MIKKKKKSTDELDSSDEEEENQQQQQPKTNCTPLPFQSYTSQGKRVKKHM